MLKEMQEIFNNIYFSVTYRESSNNSRANKQKYDPYDSNNVWHHININPNTSQLINDYQIHPKERNLSLHNKANCVKIDKMEAVLCKTGGNKAKNNTSSITNRSTNTGSFNDTQTIKFSDLKKLMKFDSKKDQIQKIDEQFALRPEYIAFYAQDIYDYECSIQTKYLPDFNYFSTLQIDINKKMRSILIDWLIDVQFKFKMRPETLFLNINYIDRYLSKQFVKRSQLQLVGVSSMLIAAKNEEIFAPQVKDLAFITEQAYTKEEIIQTESQILMTLDFDINVPTCYHFIQRFQVISPIAIKHLYLVQYVLELYLIFGPQEHHFSLLAAGAFYFIRKIKKYEPSWTPELEMITERNEGQIRPYAKELCMLLQNSQSGISYFQAVIKKFSSSKYLKVAQLRIGRQNDKPDQYLTSTSTMIHLE